MLLPGNKVMEKILSLSVLTRNYRATRRVRRFRTRVQMWEVLLEPYVNEPVRYLEFGVWKGNSILHLAGHLKNPESRLFGFDSFEGLPESWDMMTRDNKKGLFSVGGNFPSTNDQRVKFLKGWFQNTVPTFIDRQKDDLRGQLIVHYDADLYSSTLFCLMHVDRLKQPYIAIFDEFPGHEARALYNYQQATGAEVEFIGVVGPSVRYPWQVMAWIRPQKTFEV